MTGGIQTQVGAQQSPAVAGDYASGNPRAYLNAGQGALVAGPNGLTIGAFAWLSGVSVDNDNAPTLLNNNGTGPVAGFVHRQQQGLITAYLADAGMTIPPGFQVAGCTEGDFWVVNNGGAASVINQKCYANFTTGLASFAATGSPGTATASSWSLAAGAGASFSGYLSGNVLTLTAITSGTITLGGILAGGATAAGTQILALLSGTINTVGSTYAVSVPEQTVGSAASPQAFTESWGVLTLTTVATGAFAVGNPVTGTAVPASTSIFAFTAGSGGSGSVAIVNNTGTASSGTLTANTNVETKWVAQSVGAPGELVKISSWPQG